MSLHCSGGRPLEETIARGERSLPRPFYGWWIVAAGFISQALAGALYFQSFGVYFVRLQEEFDWSRTTISGAFSLARLESGMLGPLQSWLIDRLGPRNVVRAGTVLFAGGFLLISQIDSVVGFYGAFLLAALGSGLTGFLTTNIVLANWFERRRARAMALAGTGGSIAGLFVPVVALALNTFGWRTTAVISAGILLCVGLPVAQLIRHSPEPYGLMPDGRRTSTKEAPAAASPVTVRPLGLTGRQALRSPAFWFISAGHSAALVAVSAIGAHLIPYLVGQMHMSLEAAATAVAAITVLQVAGNFVAGFLGDRVDKRLMCMACMVGHTAAMLSLAAATTPIVIFGCAALHGLSWGTRGPLMSAIRADYFGRRSFAAVEGFASLVTMVGLFIGPLSVGLIADVIGDYRFAFLFVAGVTTAGFVFFGLARRPQVRAEPTAI